MHSEPTALAGPQERTTSVLDDWRPRGIDVTTPNVARMYNYFLGGKDHYAPDREAAEQALAAAPGIRALARANRAFLTRAVRFLADGCGIRQFIDLGAGLPTQNSTHEIAPEAHVVYIDNDPVALAHARALVEHPNRDRVAVIDADLREPGHIINHPTVRERIDFARPVGVLALLMLHFLTDTEKPAKIVGEFHKAMAPGSYLAISHGTGERRGHSTHPAARVYDQATSTVTLRSRDQIRGLFDGFALTEPGLVYLPEWRPDLTDPTDPEDPYTRDAGDTAWGVLAGVGKRTD